MGEYLGRIRDKIYGPEKIFSVRRVEVGKECSQTYQSLTLPSGGDMGAQYSSTMRVRPITVELYVDGFPIRVSADENIEREFVGSKIDLYPEEVNALQQLIGQPIRMRAKIPYVSTTLKNLIKIHSKGESK